MKLLLLVTISAAISWGQTGVIDGPTLGLLPDASSGALRTIQGIPGAAMLGPSLETVKLGVAGRTHALVVLENGTAALVSAAGRLALPDAEMEISQVALSPRGSAAILYSGASHSARIITGLPDGPKLDRLIPIPGVPRALAVTDDGQSALTVASHGRSGDTVSLHTATGTAVLYRARRIGAAEFLPGTTRAAIAGSDGVVLIGPDLGVEAVSTDSDAVAVGISADGAKLAIAGHSGRITLLDLRGGTPRSTTCQCAPNTLAPLRGNAVFRLTAPGDGVVWVVDADSAEPGIHFVATQGGER